MKHIISFNGRSITADSSRSLLDNLALGGAQIHAPCGGNGSCRQCRVSVRGTLRDASGNTRQYENEEVLACRVYPAGDVSVRSSGISGQQIRTDSASIAAGAQGLGLAVDIGTTTVAAYLYDLASGECIATRGAMNAQRSFGSDVISRIGHASSPGGLEALSSIIRQQISSMAADMCPDIGSIKYISLAGNTVMEHILTGLSPESIGKAPFTPLSLFGGELAAGELFPGFDCPAYICPAIAGYVGGDISAGLLASGADRAQETILFIDIGTNGEMALGNRDGFLCCATAAGPAFEGAEIECGSPAQEGAISLVQPDMSFTVIGGAQPRSICGSGLVDATAALLACGELDETGRLENGDWHFSPEVYLSGRDIRQIQLAKAAIRAGIETLLDASGKGYDDISRVLIAGGFGAYMRTKSACAIGLLPPALEDRIEHVGNAAGVGAAQCLTPQGRSALKELCRRCSYIELSSSSTFNDKYIEAMMFDEFEEVFS